jgi:hypothetical protein
MPGCVIPNAQNFQTAGCSIGSGPPTVAATVYAEDGEPAEAALAPAMAVAEAIAAKLP